MIPIPCLPARPFRALLRKTVLASAPRGPCPPVLVAVVPDGLLLRAAGSGAGLTCQVSAPPAPLARLGIPAKLLARIEGSTEALVTLEVLSTRQGVARWTERGIPRSTTFLPAPETELPEPLDLPGTGVSVPVEFLKALDSASRTAAREPGPRYVLPRV